MTYPLPTDPDDQKNAVICAAGYVLRKRDWAEHGKECLTETCPHPFNCPLHLRTFRDGGDK